jgi:SAM-dependent methyltransferase
MTKRITAEEPESYWEQAGKIGYAQAMYSSVDVERHVRKRLWNVAIEIADQVGIPRNGHVLDYGCGDGAFANEVLAPLYRAIDGYDIAVAAIERAKLEARGPHLRFEAVDLVGLDHAGMPRYDGVFLMGILHHIKMATPVVLRSLRFATDKMVVLEPNGNHLLRKALEYTASYRAAGEDSFRTRELIGIFNASGWQVAAQRRLNLFPNFTPGWAYRLLGRLEPRIEASRFWNALCTVNMLGVVRR